MRTEERVAPAFETPLMNAGGIIHSAKKRERTYANYGSREGHRLEFGVWRLEFGAWSLELGVWSLEFGAWSLALGVWSLDGVCHAMGEGRWAGSMGRIAHGAFDRVKRSTYFQARL